MNALPLRGVHLDFHTSPDIASVGDEFDPDEFVQTLTRARVNSITVFARCHHGMCYYPSKVAPVHPGLKFDLMGSMIEACQKAAIRVNVYTTVSWDEHAAALHADWLQVDRDGKLAGRGPLGGARWRDLCMNSPLADYVLDQTEEVVRGYPVDGLFFDIVRNGPGACYCNHCMRSMLAQGRNPEDRAQVVEHNLQVARRFMRRAVDLVRKYRPDAGIFFNSRLRIRRDPEPGMRPEIAFFSHWEIESLPSGGWGYNHFPLFARYFQTLKRPILSHTGRFHLSWGDFGGLKNPAALDYECARMLAAGAACVVGDQLHPRGRLDGATYDLIGKTYARVEAVEPWCTGAVPEAEIAVLANDMAAEVRTAEADDPARQAMEGALRMLLELKHQFHVVDAGADLSPYRVIVLADERGLDRVIARKLRDFVSSGGAILATHEAALDEAGEGFAIPEFGLTFERPSEWATAYVHVDASVPDDIRRQIPDYDHVVYERGSAVAPEPGTEVLARVTRPYFNRTWRRFVSHAQTPPESVTSLPAASIKGRCAYIAFPLFRSYRVYGNRFCRDLVGNVLARLLPKPMLRIEGPSGLEATILRQPQRADRRVVHLVYGTAERRALRIDVIEDTAVATNLPLALRTAAKPRSVTLQPQGRKLECLFADGYAQVTVPEIRGHQIVVFE